MLDPTISLAFCLQASPGVYSLLLGSGLSRSAGILTGWEIVQDLVRQYATLAGENPGPDPIAWYVRKLGSEPTYSGLLNDLAATSAERNRILRRYFEPTPEERDQGVKMPTPAHQAIARLTALGYFRMIVTTNFDRLIETALESAGVAPTVISSEDQAMGSTPIQHNRCTVLKVNGDYLDSRIRNTSEELATYGEKVTELLDRIFDEYGLVVCGWSGDWDTALRGAIERSRSRRFTTFWTTRHELREHERRLVEDLRATVIRIKDADSFFVDVADKVLSISELGSPHPLTSRVAVGTIKRFLPDPNQEIRLRDLISNEVETLTKELNPERFPSAIAGPVAALANHILKRLARYEALTDTLLQMLCVGVTFGRSSLDDIWLNAVKRIATTQEGGLGGYEILIVIRGYPAVLLLYGTGIAALAAKRIELMARIMLMDVRDEEGERPLLNRRPIGHHDIFKMLPGFDRHKTPLSDRLHDVLRDPLRPYLPDDEDFERMFDRFEYVLNVVSLSATRSAPLGRFTWRRPRHGWKVYLEKLDPYWTAARAWLPPTATDFLEAAESIDKWIEYE